MKLIAHAKFWHQLWSIRLALLGAMFEGAKAGWEHLPDAWKPTLNSTEQWIFSGIGIVISMATAGAVLIKQPGLMDKISSSAEDIHDDTH